MTVSFDVHYQYHHLLPHMPCSRVVHLWASFQYSMKEALLALFFPYPHNSRLDQFLLQFQIASSASPFLSPSCFVFDFGNSHKIEVMVADVLEIRGARCFSYAVFELQ